MTDRMRIAQIFFVAVFLVGLPSILMAGGSDCEVINIASPTHDSVRSVETAYASDYIAIIARVVIDSADSKVKFYGRSPLVHTTYSTTVREVFKTDDSHLKAGDRFAFIETAGRATHAGCWYVMTSFPEPLVAGDEYLVFLRTTKTRTHYSVSPWDSYAVTDEGVVGRRQTSRAHVLPKDALSVLRTLVAKTEAAGQ
ncbi:MAG: hypothetical protein ACYC7A_00090 [Thermoanaerobaculia bacterium]